MCSDGVLSSRYHPFVLVRLGWSVSFVWHARHAQVRLPLVQCSHSARFPSCCVCRYVEQFSHGYIVYSVYLDVKGRKPESLLRLVHHIHPLSYPLSLTLFLACSLKIWKTMRRFSIVCRVHLCRQWSKLKIQSRNKNTCMRLFHLFFYFFILFF